MSRMHGVIAVTAVLLGASLGAQSAPRDPRANDEPKAIKADMKNGSGGSIGHAELRQTPNGILLRVMLRDVPPGTHAFHIHETGRCDTPDFKSAGGHFAPGGSEHGFLDEKGPHPGDLPNLHVGEDGDVTIELFVEDLALAPGPRSLLDGDGSALVVHSDADDYHANPAGDAGNRIGCGVIAEEGPVAFRQRTHPVQGPGPRGATARGKPAFRDGERRSATSAGGTVRRRPDWKRS